MIELNCQLGEIIDLPKCSEALSIRTAHHELQK
jgi:hypothetical protein